MSHLDELKRRLGAVLRRREIEVWSIDLLVESLVGDCFADTLLIQVPFVQVELILFECFESSERKLHKIVGRCD